MKHFVLVPAALFALAACSNSDAPEVEAEPAPVAAPSPMSAQNTSAAEDGSVVISVDRVVDETQFGNCLLMIAVSNGLEETVSAGLFTFEVSGGGESTGASMFPQTTEPGETKLAQVILSGQSCDVAQVIEGGQPQCSVNPGSQDATSCLDVLVFEDNAVDFSVND